MKIKISILVLYPVLFLNSQMISATASNPLGINGGQEVFYAFLSLWALFSVLRDLSYKSETASLALFVFLTPLVLTMYGSVAANFNFGQPLEFGILEERRIFALYVFFPISDMLRMGKITMEQLEKAIVTVLLTLTVLMIGVYIDILPSWNDVRTSNVALRGERLSIGASFLAAFLPVVFLRMRSAGSIKMFAVFFFAVFSLVFIVQSRQLLAGTTLAIMWAARVHRLIFLATILSIGALAFSSVLLEQFTLYQELFSRVFSEEYTSDSWRALGILEVVRSLSAGEVWGHGSLSPFWQSGFTRIFGDFFFLADIGLFGTIYRYGYFGILWYAAYVIAQVRYLLGIRSNEQRRTYFGIFLFLIVLLPVAAPLEYRGFQTGLLLAITAYLATERKLAQTARHSRSNINQTGLKSA